MHQKQSVKGKDTQRTIPIPMVYKVKHVFENPICSRTGFPIAIYSFMTSLGQIIVEQEKHV